MILIGLGIVAELLRDILLVLERADSQGHILSPSVIPIDFYELDANRILESYEEYTKSKKTFRRISIKEKKERKHYGTFYQLYHDIKIAAASKIRDFDIGSKEYNDIDFFYKFATELILRESSRLKVVLFEGNDEEQTDLQKQLLEEFNKIAYTYTVTNGEVIFYISKGQDSAYGSIGGLGGTYGGGYMQSNLPQQTSRPLFSSLINKSGADPRLTVVPDPYQLSKVVPLSSISTRSEATLDSISPSFSKMTPQGNQSAEILSKFFHPNWYTVHIPTWLTYKNRALKPPVSSSLLKSQQDDDLRMVANDDVSVNTFAPTVDLRVAVVTEGLKGRVWLNHLGYRKIQELRKNYFRRMNGESEEGDKNQESLSNFDEQIDSLKRENGQDGAEGETKQLEQTAEAPEEDKVTSDSSISSLEVNVANLVKWDPHKIDVFESIKAEKNDITASPVALQRLISSNILNLNRLRQERYLYNSSNNHSSPSIEEKKLYDKTMKYVTLCMQLNNVGTSGSNLSKRIPALLHEYSGTLPGMASLKASSVVPKSARLPSIRGPYKKRNRQ